MLKITSWYTPDLLQSKENVFATSKNNLKILNKGFRSLLRSWKGTDCLLSGRGRELKHYFQYSERLFVDCFYRLFILVSKQYLLFYKLSPPALPVEILKCDISYPEGIPFLQLSLCKNDVDPLLRFDVQERQTHYRIYNIRFVYNVILI